MPSLHTGLTSVQTNPEACSSQLVGDGRSEHDELDSRDIQIVNWNIQRGGDPQWTTDLATVDEKASLRQAALFIEKHHIGCLPVVVDGKLRGIITDTDFVGVAINLLEQLEESEPLAM